ncbi:hypothetical protein HNQ59_001155 [Chitinivorax tropicus]|uniref:Type II secretion system protein N n=1 Tax=Chitinivorax tropicus TaxID=714531 RepID=A0A840MK58_9PROT|nr:type II secretion system protein N [Chitinivorax tropicus]MBB5017885.1 hypothetical protein [Chitinivorax tropicus]
MIRKILVIALLYLLFLVSTAPASLLPMVLDKVLPGRIGLIGLSGSIWQGHAQQLTLDGQVLADKLDWSLSAWRLLTGRLGIDLQATQGKAKVVADTDSILLKETQLSLPLPLLGQVVKPIGLYQLTGQGALNTQQFEWDRGVASGELVIEWRQAASGMVSLPTLGDYRLEAKAGPRGFSGKVSTLSGALNVSGDGTWSQKEGLSVHLQLRPDPAQAAVLRPLLSVAGQPAADGTYYLNTSLK